MRLLLDTQVLIWSIVRTGRLRNADSDLIRTRSNEVFFSAASIWEIGIKRALRRPDFDLDPHRFLATARLDFKELPVTAEIAALVADLPLHHRDPFDRFLVVQTREEDATLLTADRALAAYGDHVRLIA